MDCKTSSNLIMSYIDNNITDKELLALQYHMSVCKNCREEFMLFNELVESICDLPMLEPSDGFEMRVIDSIDHSIYKSSTSKWLGIKEILISTIIYFGFLFSFSSSEATIISLNSVSKIVQQLYLLGGFIEGIIEYIMVGSLYTRKMMFYLLGFFSRATTSTLVFYTISLLVLAAVLVMIQTTLYKILKNQ
ncbi:zf-HC2 domain-containing protein [Alkaliphilus pronyensis]|uniref:Zf-HC2 domain-containing protein n=1 Tax=Alkaliphilus pronyensis TaxID=1482732 RepID=A0A6I0F943_9FIRM|nr:zf-HC2 domain-containing protein [Alkaliphilus pronyensis]KAB3532431.1 zf-HC2 domain-containing protein [Alkaliphilus pronyensis]